MTELRERLGVEPKRSEVVRDACRVLDEEVEDKSGLGGLAIKAAYSLVKGVKPGFVAEVVDALLDDFLDALDPTVREARSRGEEPAAHLQKNASLVADALLAVTDRRAERAQRPAIRGAYDRLRPTAKKHVEAAAPRLARMLEKHAP